MFHLRRINFASYLTSNKPVSEGNTNGSNNAQSTLINDKIEPTKGANIRSKSTYIL